MDVQDVITEARDALTVRRVFGEAYERNGLTIIPVAKVWGGAGGGQGEDRGKGEGSGAGFGLIARPVGAYVVRGESVTWRPSVDVNRVIAGLQVIAVVALLAIRAALKRRDEK